MKIPFKKSFDENSDTLMRRCGYARQYNKKFEKFSYYKRLGASHFPKFHVYINSEKPLELDIHLDQKQITHEGLKAHMGESNSNIVRAEALRVYNIILALGPDKKIAENKPVKKKDDEEKGWLGRFF